MRTRYQITKAGGDTFHVRYKKSYQLRWRYVSSAAETPHDDSPTPAVFATLYYAKCALSRLIERHYAEQEKKVAYEVSYKSGRLPSRSPEYLRRN